MDASGIAEFEKAVADAAKEVAWMRVTVDRIAKRKFTNQATKDMARSELQAAEETLSEFRALLAKEKAGGVNGEAR